MDRTLVFGATGRLGREVLRSRRDGIGLSSAQCDVTDRARVLEVVAAERPDVIVNCAGLTDAAACERDPARARAVNVEGVGHIAEAARRHGAFMVHLSSDHAVAPVNMYGRTKLAAEGLVPGLVLRGKFYSKQHWLLRALREGRPVQLLTTCWFNPLTSATLVAYLDALVAGRRRGVVNVGVMDRISYHEFGLLMCEVFGLPARLIGEVTTLELPYVLPADTYLDVSGLAGLGLKSLTARQDMERLAA